MVRWLILVGQVTHFLKVSGKREGRSPYTERVCKDLGLAPVRSRKIYSLLSCAKIVSRAAVLGRLGSLSPTKSGCSILPTARLYGGRSLPRFASGLSCRLNFRGRAHPTTRRDKEM